MVPGADIHIYEAGRRPLAKLALTGGGRCNLTNTFEEVTDLRRVYPRGSVFMKRGLKEFGPDDVTAWFRGRGVRLKVEDGGRVFPVSDDAREVVDTLLEAVSGASIACGKRISAGDLPEDGPVVVTTGGGGGMEVLRGLPVNIVPPVPSLFSFNIEDVGSMAAPSAEKSSGGSILPPGGSKPGPVAEKSSRSGMLPPGANASGAPAVSSLMGISVDAELSIPGTEFHSGGALLITDWGFSGPAVLRLSSYAARYLAQNAYRAPLCVNWTALPPEEIRDVLASLRNGEARRQVKSSRPFGLPGRLWEYLVLRSGTEPACNWASLGNKGLEALAAVLAGDNYRISGKTRFRDEFVTCGGVALDSVNLSSLECRGRKGLFFAGEVLDIDAVTGGFNLQAAWTTAYMAAKTIASYL